MHTINKAGFIIIMGLLSACANQPKEIVNAPLKLSEASETKTHVCGSYGCEDALRERCEGSDFRILNQDTLNKHDSRKDHATGVWHNTRTESVKYVFKCVTE